MSFLEVSTSIGCPMRCSYCPQDSVGKAYSGPRLLDVDTFAAALANCPPGLEVSFAGFAEPFLNRACSALIALAVISRPVLVYTTGVGMDDLDVETLVQVQPCILMLHLPDRDGDMKTKVTVEYVARLHYLCERVPHVESVCYGSLHPDLVGLKTRHRNYPLHSRAGNVTKLVHPNKSGPLRCRVAPELDENVLLPSGELALCCNDWALQHIIGDLTRETWEEIHAGERLNAVRNAMGGGDCLCRTCEFAVPA